MSNYGYPVWFDLYTSDVEKAKAFYSETFNWSTDTQDTPLGPYTMFKANGEMVAGVSVPQQEVLNNQWVAYVSVENLDNAISTLQSNGGEVVVPKVSAPGIGSWVYAKDPDGVLFAPFQFESADKVQVPKDLADLGTFCWHELMSNDYEKALNFYGQIFGWEKSTTNDMGNDCLYQLYKSNGRELGGMFNVKAEMNMKPCWAEYVRVENVTETQERALSLGGKETFPAMDVPGGGKVAGFLDNSGINIAVWNLGS